MKLIKRRTRIKYKEITELQWQQAYSKYLEICIMRPGTNPSYSSINDFQMFAANIWLPIAEVELPVETEEKFIQRVTKTEKKEDFTDLQFIANGYGEVVSCILF